MIELFDGPRLLPRRDHSLLLASLVLAAGAAALAVHAATLQRQLLGEQARKTELEGSLRQALARQAPSAALINDLQRELQTARAELAQAGSLPTTSGNEARTDATPTPADWLDRLAALGSPEVSLTRVEIDAQGGARIEGVAVSPQAVSGFVQAFSRHEALAGLKPRAVELRQDKTQAPHLRFQLRATAPAVQGAPLPAQAAAATTAAASSPGGRS